MYELKQHVVTVFLLCLLGVCAVSYAQSEGGGGTDVVQGEGDGDSEGGGSVDVDVGDEGQGDVDADPRITELAEHFGVEEEIVSKMMENNMGWGEIENSLAFAERVSLSDPDNPRPMDETLTELLDARADGRGWGEIAQDYDLKWGQVVGSYRRSEKASEKISQGKARYQC